MNVHLRKYNRYMYRYEYTHTHIYTCIYIYIYQVCICICIYTYLYLNNTLLFLCKTILPVRTTKCEIIMITHENEERKTKESKIESFLIRLLINKNKKKSTKSVKKNNVMNFSSHVFFYK